MKANNIVEITTAIVRDYNTKKKFEETFPTKERLQQWTDQEMQVKREYSCEIQQDKPRYWVSRYYSDMADINLEGIMIYFEYHGTGYYYNILNISELTALMNSNFLDRKIISNILLKKKQDKFFTINTNDLFYILRGLKQTMKKKLIYLVDYSCKDCKSNDGVKIQPPQLPDDVGYGGFFKKISKTKKNQKTKKTKIKKTKIQKTKNPKTKKNKNQKKQTKKYF